jgi:hypothetical protein
MSDIARRAADAARIHAYYLQVKDTPEEKERRRQKAAHERAANRELCNERTRAWRAKNPNWNSDYRRANLGRYAAHAMKRYATQKQQTPPWFDERRAEIVYEVAAQMSRELGIDMQVDHVVPLQGELVSGLHVHINLQILTARANQQKNNSFAVT